MGKQKLKEQKKWQGKNARCSAVQWALFAQ